MAEDIDIELELAAAKARARKKADVAQREAQATADLGQRPGAVTLPRGSSEALGPASTSGAALRGFGSGASLGFVDELSGGARAAAMLGVQGGAGLANLVNPGGGDVAATQMGETLGVSGAGSMGAGDAVMAAYRKGRDEARLEAAQSRRAAPGTYLASEMAGGLVAPVPGLAARTPLQTVGSRMVQGAKYGAGIGAVAGLGHSSDDVTEDGLGGALADTATGALTGAAMGAVVGPAEYAWVRKIQPALQRMAQERAVAAITPTAGLSNRLKKEGYVSPEEIQGLGRDVLQSDVLRFGGTASGAQARNLDAMSRSGEAIGEQLTKADDLVAAGVARPASLGHQVSSTIRALRDAAAETAAQQAETQRIGPRLMETIGVGQNRPAPSFSELWKTKSQLQSSLRPDEVSNLGQKMYRRGVQGYTRGVYEQAEAALGPDDIGKLREAAGEYGRAARIGTFLDDAATRAQQRQPIGLTDMLRGQQMGQAFGGLPGMLGTLGSAAVRGRLDSSIATAANAMSRVRPPTSAVGQYLSPAKPLIDYTQRPSLSEEEDVAVRAFLSGG